MSVLRQMSAKWSCAGRSVEILQLILDSRDGPGGGDRLKIFNDTRRTSYGLQVLLGQSAARQESNGLEMFDFFDMTFPYESEINSFLDPVGPSVSQDWLE